MASTPISFRGSIALITGSNKGIGYETARQLGQSGIIVLIGARDKTRGEQAMRKLAEENIQAKWIELDVTKNETVLSAALKVFDEHGRLDILVNNAAVYLEGESPSQTHIHKMRQTFETNFFGPFTVIQAFLPLLRRSPHGRIVNVSSRMASFGNQLPDRNKLAYSTSKTALNMMTLQFDKEFRANDWRIKINSVNPGLAKTDMNNNKEDYPPPSEAAQSIAHFATLPDDGPSGLFFGPDKNQLAW